MVATVRGVDIFDTTKMTETTCTVTPATGVGAAVWQSADIVRGVTKSDNTTWQGWYSQTYTGADPASTLVYTGEVPAAASVTTTASAEKSFTFGWIIATASDGAHHTATLDITQADESGVHAVATVDGVAVTLYLPLQGTPASEFTSKSTPTL